MVDREGGGRVKTVTIQIGNSDDRLSQAEWSEFVHQVSEAVARHAARIHFAGFSPAAAKWQNAAFVIECDDSAALAIKSAVVGIRMLFKQFGVAWTEGSTLFV